MRWVVWTALLWGCATTEAKTPPAQPLPAPIHAAPTRPAKTALPPPAPTPTRVFSQPVVDRLETHALVLVYHEFDRGPEKLSVSTKAFEEQLDWLDKNGVEIVSLRELLDYLDGKLELPAKVAVITIDDAWQSVYTHAWPILKRRGVRFTLGVPSGIVDHPKNAHVMTWAEIKELVDSGLGDVASHGHMHRALPRMSGRWLKEELELSRDIITKRTGQRPIAYFYPLGAFSHWAGKQVKSAGYRGGFRATGAPISVGSGSRWWLPRMGVFHGDSSWTLAGLFTRKRLAQVRRAP